MVGGRGNDRCIHSHHTRRHHITGRPGANMGDAINCRTPCMLSIRVVYQTNNNTSIPEVPTPTDAPAGRRHPGASWDGAAVTASEEGAAGLSPPVLVRPHAVVAARCRVSPSSFTPEDVVDEAFGPSVLRAEVEQRPRVARVEA